MFTRSLARGQPIESLEIFVMADSRDFPGLSQFAICNKDLSVGQPVDIRRWTDEG